jgi:hypothetical protein
VIDHYWCCEARRHLFLWLHRLAEGITLINEIKSHMNNFRLSTYAQITKEMLNKQEQSIESKMSYLYSLPSPYEIKNGVRYLRGSNNLVSEKLKIIVIDENYNRFYYSSISECSRHLNIGRTNIKNCILSALRAAKHASSKDMSRKI